MLNLNIPSQASKQNNHESISQPLKSLLVAPLTVRQQPNPSSFNSPRCLSSRNTQKKFFKPQIQSEATKCSSKQSGIVRAYAAATNHGLVRNYNQDRVSIILNIVKPPHRTSENWPRCSFFGVYDGHGGSLCADFLRDNLHQFVIRNPHFPFNPKQAIRNGFAAAEKAFLQQARAQTPYQRSGSCAVIALIIGQICYVANVGDSRAIMSGEKGVKIYPLSKDHKPSQQGEQMRIINNGGRVYQSAAPNNSQAVGPHRVFPGRLSVSRTFGDLQAKDPQLGGNPQVLIFNPDIKAFRVTSDFDFIILASDGIYDKLTNREVIQSAWSALFQNPQTDIHKYCGASVQNVMKTALGRRSLDNLTVVQIAFQGFASKVSNLQQLLRHFQKNGQNGDIVHHFFFFEPLTVGFISYSFTHSLRVLFFSERNSQFHYSFT